VPPERMGEAADLLTSLGFVHLRNYREDHKTLHKKFDRGRVVACFHLHHQVSWVGSVFLSPDAIWRQRQLLPGFEGAWQLHPSHLVEQAIAHAVYEKATISLAELRRVLVSIAQGGVDPGQIAADAAERGWLAGLRLGIRALAAIEQASCETRRIADLFEAGPSGSPIECRGPTIPLGRWKGRALFVRKILGCRTDPLAKRARLLFGFLWSKFHSLTRIPYHRPLLVALSGMDGAGKSYYRNRLHDLLTNCDIGVRSVWARGGSTDFVLWLKGVARRATGPSGPFAVQPTDNQLGKSWQRLLWPWVVVLELLGTYLLRVVPALLGRRIALCDRYVLDAAVDLSFRLGDENVQARTAWRLIEFLAPRPDLHFLFDVSPREAARRKDLEVSAAHLEERRRRYQTFRSADVRVIDTERDQDDVADEVGEILLRAILEEDS
jgi:thymidylate kinase